VKPRFFSSAEQFGEWLQKHHDRQDMLLVGFHKVGSGKPSMTWSESVDEALCWGWIDGVRNSLGADDYVIRFTPRKRMSRWSAINIRRAKSLIRQKRMQPRGLEAFIARRDNRSSGQYSYEQRPHELPQPYAEMLARNAKARKFFESQPPYYRRTATWWVVSAKKEETRTRRAESLIDYSAKGERIPQFARPTAATRGK
jgi:uncharacterized protein YdeI (YjbR/CyaY-like superfamily)